MPRVRLTIELEVLGDVRDPVRFAADIVTRQGFRVVDARPASEPASPPAQRDLFDPKEPPC